MSSITSANQRPYDPRSIANLLLDEADRLAINITNLSLQKLLYFAHGLSLIEDGKPLVSGYFEAWQHGPVHPLVYLRLAPSRMLAGHLSLFEPRASTS